MSPFLFSCQFMSVNLLIYSSQITLKESYKWYFSKYKIISLNLLPILFIILQK
ncbi:hypothetical protein GS458_0685 [Geobacillus stearothermophilus]|nr:hypothetical protein GS458_0685 [Geobacillus stearothermophilus]